VAFWCEYPRDVLRVSGDDAQTYLHSQLSQDLRDLDVGATRWSLVLEPTGRVDALLRVWRTGEGEYVLDTDAGYGDALAARLNRFRIRVKATIEPVEWRCLAVRGAIVDGGLPSWGEGVDLLGVEVQPPADVPAGTAEDLLAARIDAVWPAMGTDIVPGETIPAETGVTDVAVSFTKGCYPGQELVERMDSRGASAPRVVRKVDAADGARPGDPVVRDGAEIGTYTSVCGRRALAMIKRSAL